MTECGPVPCSMARRRARSNRCCASRPCWRGWGRKTRDKGPGTRDCRMAIIVVGGNGRGVGKTALVCGVIAALPELEWIAVKITADTHVGLPPVYEELASGKS